MYRGACIDEEYDLHDGYRAIASALWRALEAKREGNQSERRWWLETALAERAMLRAHLRTPVAR